VEYLVFVVISATNYFVGLIKVAKKHCVP